MPKRYSTQFKVGQDNLKIWGMDVHPPVFFCSAFIILLFVCGSILAPDNAKVIFELVKTWVIEKFDWLFIYSGNFFIVFCVLLILSPYSKIRIGGKEAVTDFSRLSWFSMLFAAGMGIGLMFWAVAEPVAYFTGWYGTPLGLTARTSEIADMALGATLFHWGFHPWAMYAVVALALAFFKYNKSLPLTIRSGFYPLLGNKVWGVIGHFIDILAVMATIFGLATSLGFGAQQASSGIANFLNIESGLGLQILVIILVTSIAIVSVVRGLDGGIKILSNTNMFLALLLFLAIVVLSPIDIVLNGVSSTVKSYFANFVDLSLWSERTDIKFLHGWTIFYWAWWVSWCPFVGMFIARISKGRTVREFLLSVLIVPTLVTALWMGVFGNTAIYQIKNGIGELANGVFKPELAMFHMLENLPFASALSGLTILLILCFFVTSSDSGSLVVDSITAGGKLDAPVPQRIFWATAEGLIAIALLVGGGSEALSALQAAAVSVGLPFTVVLIALCFSLFLGLKHEWKYKYKK